MYVGNDDVTSPGGTCEEMAMVNFSRNACTNDTNRHKLSLDIDYCWCKWEKKMLDMATNVNKPLPTVSAVKHLHPKKEDYCHFWLWQFFIVIGVVKCTRRS